MKTLIQGISVLVVATFINVCDGGSVRPSCYSCEFTHDPSSCNTTVRCLQDEMCYVREFTTYGVKRYRMGCVNKKYCGSDTNPAVGRRQMDQKDCSLCCDSELCNAAACVQPHTGSGHVYALSKLSQATTCSDSSWDTCKAFGQLNKDACALNHVANLCPRSCSLCDHFGWATWGSWGKCSRTCNPGLRVRYRKCESQFDNLSYNGTCGGVSLETDSCLVTWCHGSGMIASSSTTIQGHGLLSTFISSLVVLICIFRQLL